MAKWCNCEKTKDEFGGCVPCATGKRCIACGKEIRKLTIKQKKDLEDYNIELCLRQATGNYTDNLDTLVKKIKRGDYK